MKKRILAFFLAVTMLTGLLYFPAAAEEGLTVKLHYNRPDGNYDDWDVWFWVNDGAAFPFAEEDGEMVATYAVEPGAAQVGFIVRNGGDSWSAKDVGADQFIDLTGLLSGTVHIYVESGVPGFERVLGDDVVAGGLFLPELALKLHYNRPDGNYDDWDVWFWSDTGAGVPFEEENGEMVATYALKPGTVQVGFIVRNGGDSWAGKDVDADQFIDVAGVLGGTIHAYVESGVPGAEIVMGEDAVTGTAILSARYDGALTVSVTTTQPVSTDGAPFTIEGVQIASVSEYPEGGYALTLAEKLDPMAKYTVVLDGREYDIAMPDYYVSADFESEFTYEGTLGAIYTPEKTTLRVWAPTAKAVTVNLYTNGDPAAEAAPAEQISMTADVSGTWVCELEGDRNGTYYTYLVDVDGAQNEACDPYARTTGVNGQRAEIIDLDATDPEGWEADTDPNAGISITDAIIYELHVRDLSVDASSGIENAGKYLGMIEAGTKNANGDATGLDHMKELGITHLHILPAYDYGSVDESKLDTPQFNWGYDPVNYNVPDGSYATDPYNGEVRVKEFKQMVKGLHDNGISVVLDVVYNHVQNAESFCFNQIVPGYFSRPGSNGSGCGNDTASERAMVSRYIVDSVKYWADEYHIDGFRFDLVGLIDTDTVNTLMEDVHETHPNVIFYGEGWTMNTAVTKPGYSMTTQVNSALVPGFAFFNDTVRDLLKGSVFDQGTGFVSGAAGKEALLQDCFAANPGWSSDPKQIVNYVSCHDNNTLIDRITVSTPEASRADQVRMNNLSAAIVMTGQGIPFLQAGEEMLRSKPLPEGGFEHNSYNRPDSVNSLKWDTLAEDEVKAVFEYYKGLIAFRKAHPVLRLTTAEEVAAAVSPVEGLDANVVAFCVKNEECELFIIFNANPESKSVTLPEGEWNICINAERAGTETIGTVSGTAEVSPISALALVRK